MLYGKSISRMVPYCEKISRTCSSVTFRVRLVTRMMWPSGRSDLRGERPRGEGLRTGERDRLYDNDRRLRRGGDGDLL